MYTFDPARELFTVHEMPDDVPVQERTESTGEFVFRIRDAFLKGDIPQIEANKRAIEALLAKFTELAAISSSCREGSFRVVRRCLRNTETLMLSATPLHKVLS